MAAWHDLLWNREGGKGGESMLVVGTVLWLWNCGRECHLLACGQTLGAGGVVSSPNLRMMTHCCSVNCAKIVTQCYCLSTNIHGRKMITTSDLSCIVDWGDKCDYMYHVRAMHDLRWVERAQ